MNLKSTDSRDIVFSMLGLHWPNARYSSLAQAQGPFLQQVKEVIPYDSLYKRGVLRSTVLLRTTKGYFRIIHAPAMPGDTVSVLLGCSLPTVLRQQPEGQHLFVGCSFIYGMLTGETLLGPLPNGWKSIAWRDRYGDHQLRFIDPARTTRLTEDPRLGPLPPE